MRYVLLIYTNEAERPAMQVTPVPGIQRDTGHGAKFKLVRATVRRSGG
jgi:hypothetical protein